MKRLRWTAWLSLPLVAACGFGGRSFTVVGPDGKHVVGAIVVAVRPGAATHDEWTGTDNPQHPAHIPSKAIHEDSRLIVYAPGCRLLDTPMPEKSTEIRLKPGIPVRLVLAEGYEFPGASLTLEAECVPIDRPAGLSDEFDFGLGRAVIPMGVLRMDPVERIMTSCLFDPGPKAADLLFPHPGRWSVRLSVMKYRVESKRGSISTHGSGTGMDDKYAVTIVVEDSEDLQTLALSPDPKAYARVLDDMRRDE